MNLFLANFFWLLIGAGLGLLLGWWLWGRRYAEERQSMADENNLLRSSFDASQNQLKACEEKLAAGQGVATKKQPAAANKPAPSSSAPAARQPAAQASASPTPENPVPASPTPESLGEDEPAPDDWKPELLSKPQGDKDDLQQIKGVGPKIEGILNDLGIYHFSQVAAFTEENIAWVNTYLKFKGRIQREKWIEQAKQLAAQK